MMFRKIIAALLCSALLFGCGSGDNSKNYSDPDDPADQNGEFALDSETSFHSAKLAELMSGLREDLSELELLPQDGPHPPLKVVGIGAGLVIALNVLVFADIIKGIVFDAIDHPPPSDYEKVSKLIEDLANDVHNLQTSITTQSTNLYKRLTRGELQAANTALYDNSFIPIANAFSDGDPTTLKYFADMIRKICEMPATSEAEKLATTQAQANAAAKVPAYIASVMNSNNIKNALDGISSKILPIIGSPRVLKLFAEGLILEYQSDGAKTQYEHTKKVMEQYLKLEEYFSLMLYRQHQAALILVNVKRHNNRADIEAGTPVLQTALEWFDTVYVPLVKDELQEFLDVTNYLVVNLYDYRDTANYEADMQYVKTGLAPENVNLKVLARSRFYCAQLFYKQNELFDDYSEHTGLSGSIIVPSDYTDNQKITIKCTGISDSNQHYVKTHDAIAPQMIPGRYPYTKWVGNKLAADHQWLSYSIDFSDPDMPTGEYSISITDHGTSKSWVHSENVIGTARVAYYNAKYNSQKPDTMTSTFVADEKHKVKFGFFAYKWPWNYQKLATSPKEDWKIAKSFVYWKAALKKTADGTITLTNHNGLVPNYINMLNLNLHHPEARNYNSFIDDFDIRSFAIAYVPDNDSKKEFQLMFSSPGDVIFIRHAVANKKSKIGYNYKLYKADTKFEDVEEFHSHEKSLGGIKDQLTHYTTVPVCVLQPYTMEKNIDYRIRLTGYYHNQGITGSGSKKYADLGMDLKWNMQFLFMGQDDSLIY
ncbi:MAG: hypothetical protein RBR43_07190 [Desulfuromonadaceae bacterium]|nr:hypothetical protein [Desulfuromonas sp.]MDY0185643.1 hypothetical protein [Desulfuromonadaceae bacterium]